MMYRLIVLNGPEAGQRWSVPAAGTIVGRDPGCTVRLSDAEVAARHAVVEFAGETLRIRDLGSMNRILVNRREVREAPLKHGDTIEIGLTRLLVEAHVQAEVADGAPPARKRRWRGAAAAAAAAAVLVAAWLLAVRNRAPKAAPAPGPDLAAESAGVPAPLPVPPPPAPAPTPAAGADLAPFSEEMRKLREDLASLREAVTDRPAPGPDEFPPAAPPDPADRLLDQARAAAAAGRLAEADRLLAGAQLISPDRADVRAERAALYERRGQVKRAIGEWTRIAEADPAGPGAARAAAELRRLRAAEAGRAGADPGVRLAELTHARFVAPEDADDLRTVHARLERAPGEPPPDPDAVALEVVFYERDAATGAVQPSTAVPPQTARLEGPWIDDEPRTLVATYRVPRGARAATAEFHGYVARLRVQGRVVTERARPLDLAAAAAGLATGAAP